MKVLHVTTNYPTLDYPIFGIFVKEQVESLQKKGIECDVFYCNGQNKGFKKYITYVPKLWWKAITGGYDIIHCHHALSAIILTMTGAPFFKKCVLSYQNDPTKEWGDKAFKFFNKTFKAFIIKNDSTPYLSYPKMHYLPNGCNEDFFKPMDMQDCRKQLGLDPDKIYILFMDSNKRVREQKRKDRFNDTLKILKDKYGYDNIEQIELRNTPRNLIPLYMNAINLHLLSSDFEGSPNSVKECMCCNTPVVSTDCGNVKSMIGDIPGCYIDETFTAEGLAKGVDMVLKYKEPFNGRQVFLDKGFSMAKVAEDIINNIYNKI
ncbi:MAG: glycosyltransferase family 4 protein [Bacteroidales bacterium]|nr:glycosyltransferase family 4 protein [Bacteroidales bacterium]MCC8174689.1 glycosyltransferase family 4 protein [Odoribacter sp.]